MMDQINDELFARIRDALGDDLDKLSGWEATTTPDGTAAWRARPTWPGGPTSITFFLQDAAAWEPIAGEQTSSANGELLIGASVQGGRVKFVVFDDKDSWESTLFPLGNPTDQ